MGSGEPVGWGGVGGSGSGVGGPVCRPGAETFMHCSNPGVSPPLSSPGYLGLVGIGLGGRQHSLVLDEGQPDDAGRAQLLGRGLKAERLEVEAAVPGCLLEEREGSCVATAAAVSGASDGRYEWGGEEGSNRRPPFRQLARLLECGVKRR